MTTREQRDKNTGLNKKHTQILNQLIAIPENKTCSDCSEVGRPSWASWNIGVFLCIQCSGIHRRMGVHISKVRSISLDKWDPKWIKSMEKGGNKKANEEWEYHLPSTFKKLPSSSPAIEHFIRDKYEKEIWKRSSPPPSNPEAIIAKYLSMTSAPSDGMSEMSYMSQSTSSYQGSSYDGGSSSRSKAGGSSMEGFGSNGQAYKNSSNDDALANAMSSLSAGWSSFASSAAEMAAVAAERAKELGEKINDDVIAPTRETLADPELMAKLQKKVKKITSTSSSSRRGGGGGGGGGGGWTKRRDRAEVEIRGSGRPRCGRGR
jgi:stromal membrane-associated protein